MADREDHKQNKKYRDILKSAQELFWKHGFKRVTVEEICKAAEISKMTYYKFFPNKIELAKTVFKNVIDEGIKDFEKIMKSDKPAAEKMKKILLLKLEGTNNISQEFINDFYDHSGSELAKFVDENSKRAWEIVAADIRDAQKNGLFRKNLNPDFFFTLASKIDYTDKSLLKFFNSPQEMVMEVLNIMMFGISPVSKENE